MKQKILRRILKIFARSVIAKYQPIIVGITGSVGKTTTKEAVAYVVSRSFRVWKTEKNNNNEIGVPLTVLGCHAPKQSLFGWFLVGLKWLRLLILPSKYPQVLVVEMAVDRPGDMEYLLSILKPDMGILTDVSSSHLEFFSSIKDIAKEKGKLLRAISTEGFAIINQDNSYTRKMRRKSCNTISYGFNEDADLRAIHPLVVCTDSQKPDGLRFKLEYEGKTLPVRLKNHLGFHQIYAVLAALSVARALGMNVLDVIDALSELPAMNGRFQLLRGILGSWVIDDTYNASPRSAIAAIEALSVICAKRKLVVLGDMLELGDEEEKGHRSLAKPIIESGIRKVFLVGERMKYLKDELGKQGFPKADVYHFETPLRLGMKLSELIASGDVFLVKGSQGTRMEKVCEIIVEGDTEQKQKLLVRQEKEWKK